MNKIFMTYEAQESPPEAVVTEDKIILNSSLGGIEKKYDIKGRLTSLIIPRGRAAEIAFKLLFDLPEDYKASTLQFELVGPNNKSIFKKITTGEESINEARECIIKLDPVDTAELKQESYKIELTYLDQNGNIFKIFQENCPVLTIK
jgi:hypothetical protein